MKILKSIVFGLLIITSYTSFAQQIPLYGQYYFNRFLYNPALTGEQERPEAYLIGRRQWTALEGYQTRAVTVSGSPENTNIGLGLNFVSDVNNLAKSNSLYGNYAYNIKMDEKSQLSLGFALGVYDYSFNMQNIVVTDMNDAALALLGQDAGPVVDGGVGLAYSNSGFMIGASFPQLFNGPIIYKDNYINSIEHNLENHYTIMASYDIKVGKNAKLQPMVMYKGAKNAPAQIDANLMLDWMDKGWLGIAYRDDYAVTAMAGVTINKIMRVGYAYDWSVSGYSAALGGSHELTFGFAMNKKVKSDQDRAKEIAEQQFTIDSLMEDRDVRIDALEKQIESVENSPNRVDTVVIVKKIVTTAPPRYSGNTGSGNSGSGNQGSGNTGNVGSNGSSVSGNSGSNNGGGVVTPRNTGSSGNFIVVVGSFTQETNATKYFNRLVRQGESPYVFYDRSRRVYYVHLGRFDNKDVARQKARSNRNTSLKPWVKTLSF